MTKILSNISELRKIVKEPDFKSDVALEFLDAIEDNAGTLVVTIDGLKKEVKDLENDDTITDTTIQCGIGTIEYKEPDNILLAELMENLEAAIKKHTPKKVNDTLSALL